MIPRRRPARRREPGDGGAQNIGLDRARWSALCDRMGLDHAAARFGILATAYAEPQRHYHDARHVRECLALFDEAAHLAERADEVELALWLHDVVYRPLRRRNEERSARVAEWWLRASEVAGAVIERVRGSILATRHDGPPGGRGEGPGNPDEEPANPDDALVRDIDLGIFGSARQRFEEYERDIRREYRWVPGPLYRRKRAGILRSFLERESVYRTSWFRERFETAARRNLEAALEKLAGGSRASPRD